ncbi:hypothetical protein KGV55_03070, partial [Candidatus Gracilibacteria bacterium]|nr:hypothetical protein [Candidatus Gracilibacteria bacterium]
GKKYVQIKVETGQRAYFDKDLQPLCIDGRRVVRAEKREIFGKKYNYIILDYIFGHTKDICLDENNEKVKINGKLLQGVYAGEGEEFHGKKFQKIRLEDIGNCYIDENWKLLNKYNEVIEDIHKSTYEFFGKKYQAVELNTMGLCWLDKNDEILKIQETVVKGIRLSDGKRKFFDKTYQEMELQYIGPCFLNKENGDVLQINGENVYKIHDDKYTNKVDGKTYQRVQCFKLGYCYITESGELLQVDGKNVVEIYQENGEKTENQDFTQMKLSDGQKITFEESLGKYVSTDLLKKTRENFEKLRRAQNVRDAFLVVLDMYKDCQSHKCKEDLKQEILEKVYAIVRNLVEHGGNSKNKIQETLDSWKDADDEEVDFFKEKLTNITKIFEQEKDFEVLLESGVSILDLHKKLGYKHDVEFPVALDCFSKENVEKIKSISIDLSNEKYYNRELYERCYEKFVMLPKNKLRLANLYYKEIYVANRFSTGGNYIVIDANYKPSLKKLEKMMEKLEAKKLKKDMQTNLPDRQEKGKQQIQDIKSKIENFGEEEKEVFDSLLEIIENLQSRVNQLEDLTSKK